GDVKRPRRAGPLVDRTLPWVLLVPLREDALHVGLGLLGRVLGRLLALGDAGEHIRDDEGVEYLVHRGGGVAGIARGGAVLLEVAEDRVVLRVHLVGGELVL